LQAVNSLSNPTDLSRARRDFERRPAGEQDKLMQRWWNHESTTQRVTWLQGWPSYFSDVERNKWLDDATHNLGHRDIVWARVAVWLQQNPGLRGEVDRYWRLLDEPAHKAAMQAWRSHQNRAYMAWLNDRVRTADGKQKEELEQPARMLAWWNARDAEEQERLEAWWTQLPEATRTQGLTTWFKALPVAAQASVAWPDWEQLTQAERDPWLQNAYKTLPSMLWPHFLAWLQWQDMEPGMRVKIIRDEVGAADATLSFVHFMLRPVDMWLDFKLMLAVLVISLGALSGFLLQYASRHQLNE
jgi:hypothetical protein